MIEILFVAFVVALAAALGMTPLVIKLAHRIGAVDHPNERKVHTHPVPRLGGVAVYIAVFLTIAVVFLLHGNEFASPWKTPLQGFGLALASLMILAVGTWDDIKQLGPGKKFLLQVLVSTVVYASGVRISIISQPLGEGMLDLAWLSYPATVLWIVGIMNALNLIDGLDGLASGVAMVASITIAAISFVKFHDAGTAVIALILAGSLLGFLRFNFNPARIFLGDSGSLFLGFMLAVLSMIGSTKGSTAFAVIIPALSLGLPILDTTLSIARRILRPMIKRDGKGESAMRRLRSIFLPDRDHIHHRLLALGLSHREAVVLLYFVSSALGCSAFGLSVTDNIGGVLILAVAGIAIMAGVHRLRYREFAILRTGALLPIYRHPLLQNSIFMGTIDAGFAVVALLVALALGRGTGGLGGGALDFRVLLIGASVLQMTVFVASGLYRGVLRHAGVEEAVRIMKAVAISLFIGAGLFLLFGVRITDGMGRVFVLDFYFLLTLLVVSRFSFALLNRLAREPYEGKDPVVIYGTGDMAEAALRTMLASPGLNLRPLGFLDDNPQMEGKTIHGYRVFGGHWKLEGLLRNPAIAALVIATDDMLPEVKRRLQRVCRENRLPVKVFAPFADFTIQATPKTHTMPIQNVPAMPHIAGVPVEKFPRIF